MVKHLDYCHGLELVECCHIKSNEGLQGDVTGEMLFSILIATMICEEIVGGRAGVGYLFKKEPNSVMIELMTDDDFKKLDKNNWKKVLRRSQGFSAPVVWYYLDSLADIDVFILLTVITFGILFESILC